MNSMTGPERLEGVTGRHWHGLDDGRIQCDVCPRYCKLNEGQRGLCFVRGRQEDAILLTTYGRSSGFCVDPIEKKPLNHDGRCGDCGSTIPGLFAPRPGCWGQHRMQIRIGGRDRAVPALS